MARKGIMLAKRAEPKDVLFKPWIAQPKIDGLRCRALVDGDNITLLSSQETEIKSLPIISDILAEAFKTFDEPFELDGELVSRTGDFQDTLSIVKRNTSHIRQDAISYKVFDLVMETSQDLRINTLTSLYDFIGLNSDVWHIQLVPSTKVIFETEAQVNTAVQKYVSEGYEGMILRNPFALYERKRSTGLLKIKPRKKETFYVVGLKEAISKNGEPKDMLGSVLCKASNGEEFYASAGKLNHDQRTVIWRTFKRDFSVIKGMQVEIEYLSLTKRGVPREPVIIKVKGFNL